MTRPVPPLILHGNPVSNYVNVVRAVLLEKSLEHRLIVRSAAQDEAFLALNPMGKVPVLETPDGPLAETVAIIEYLDDRYPDVPLRPADTYRRAQARQLVNVVQVYVEAPTRSLFPGVFMGGTNTAAAVDAGRTTLDRAVQALRRLMRPEPFLFGAEPTSADLFAFYNLDIADRLGRFVWQRSIIDELGVADWAACIRARPSSTAVLADFAIHFADYLKTKGAVYRAPSDNGHLRHA